MIDYIVVDNQLWTSNQNNLFYQQSENKCWMVYTCEEQKHEDLRHDDVFDVK